MKLFIGKTQSNIEVIERRRNLLEQVIDVKSMSICSNCYHEFDMNDIVYVDHDDEYLCEECATKHVHNNKEIVILQDNDGVKFSIPCNLFDAIERGYARLVNEKIVEISTLYGHCEALYVYDDNNSGYRLERGINDIVKPTEDEILAFERSRLLSKLRSYADREVLDFEVDDFIIYSDINGDKQFGRVSAVYETYIAANDELLVPKKQVITLFPHNMGFNVEGLM